MVFNYITAMLLNFFIFLTIFDQGKGICNIDPITLSNAELNQTRKPSRRFTIPISVLETCVIGTESDNYRSEFANESAPFLDDYLTMLMGQVADVNKWPGCRTFVIMTGTTEVRTESTNAESTKSIESTMLISTTPDHEVNQQQESTTASNSYSKRPLKIAQVSFPVDNVPPSGYGGIERIVYYLVEEMVKQGHKVTLFAPAGSNTSAAELVFNLKWKHLDPNARYAKLNELKCWQIEQLKRRVNEFDIIHFHYDVPAECYIKLDAKDHNKIVATLHGLGEEWIVQSWIMKVPNIQMVSISNDQVSRLKDKSLKYNLVNIYHGIPQNLYTFTANPDGGKEKYLAFIGRIVPKKGVHSAIHIAVRAGIRLKIAARMNGSIENGWVDNDYLENVVKPLLGKHPGMIDIVGEINDTQKSTFLGNALALIFPIHWNEPFGMVMIEAMACGTPVVARRKGAVAEVVDENITGLIFDTDDQAVETVKRVHNIDRAGVRRRFEQKFTDKIMANNYVKLFERMVERNEKQTTADTNA